MDKISVNYFLIRCTLSFITSRMHLTSINFFCSLPHSSFTRERVANEGERKREQKWNKRRS